MLPSLSKSRIYLILVYHTALALVSCPLSIFGIALKKINFFSLQCNNCLILICREVVLGEHVVGKDPDCSKKDPTKCNPPVIRRNLDQQRDIIVHEGYDQKTNYKHDIALIRFNDPIPLFQENPQISAANPICLPWSEDNFAYFIGKLNY